MSQTNKLGDHHPCEPTLPALSLVEGSAAEGPASAERHPFKPILLVYAERSKCARTEDCASLLSLPSALPACHSERSPVSGLRWSSADDDRNARWNRHPPDSENRSEESLFASRRAIGTRGSQLLLLFANRGYAELAIILSHWKQRAATLPNRGEMRVVEAQQCFPSLPRFRGNGIIDLPFPGP